MTPTLPIVTPRLTVRMMTPDDAEVLVAYRNDPEVARHQLWDLPYTLDQAGAMLSDQRSDEQLEPGGRYQLAIEVGGAVVGDVFVGFGDSGGPAEVGFTLARHHHGNGYATEAAGAVVEVLFDRLGCVRVLGELDPVNVASQRVLEGIGLVYEGTTKRSFLWRGEWTDNMSYSATVEEFEVWRRRPRTRPAEVSLVELDAGNHRKFVALRTHHSQERFVSTNSKSIVDAHFPPQVQGAPLAPWMRGIVADGVPVGFVMLADATDHHPEPHLWRLMIDRLHQRRGIAQRAVAAVVDHLASRGDSSMSVSWVDEPGGPRRFYERLGFVTIGYGDDGEIEARKRW